MARAHREERRLQDVDLVDLLLGGKRDAVGERLLRDNVIQRLAALGRQLFRVVQAGNVQPARQDDRRSAHRSGQRAAPGLVYAADRLIARLPAAVFVIPKFRHANSSFILGNTAQFSRIIRQKCPAKAEENYTVLLFLNHPA